MAEKIAVAQNIGALTLSLRSLADNTADLEAAIASGEVTVPGEGDAKAEKQMLLAIAAMPNDRGTSATTGGEVSRYRSDEHTSELQSLMRISYAVFRLKNTTILRTTPLSN